MQWIQNILGVPLGWIMRMCYTVLQNYGLSLIIFTLLTKLLMFPLAIKQQKSMINTQRVQPKLQELQKKYKNNPQKLQEEQAKLYKEENIKLSAGCLPLLIQFPILIGLIDVIYKPLNHILNLSADLITRGIEMVGASGYAPQLQLLASIQSDPGRFSELGADFVSAVQNFDFSFFGLNLTGQPSFEWNRLLLIPIISGITAVLSSFLSMRLQRAASNGAQAGGMGSQLSMIIIMPLFSVFFAFQVPAGVGIYWILSNIFQIFQQLIMNVLYNPKKIIAEYEEKERLRKLEEKKKNVVKVVEVDDKGREIVKEKAVSEKELNRIRLAEARKRDAEKYGDEEYVEVSDDDLM